MRSGWFPVLLLLACCLAGWPSEKVFAQTPPPPPYGTSITLDQAKKVAAAAEAEAKKNRWEVVIAVVDTGGNLVLLHRIDNAQIASVDIARQKAWTAVAFRRPTKSFEDVIAGGGSGARVLAFPGLVPAEGGVPIIVDGKIVGGIGISGVTSQQDGVVAKAALEALK